MEPLTPIKPEYWIIKKEYWKISKGYWEISAAYRLKVVCLSLKDCVLIAQGLRAYRSRTACLSLKACVLIARGQSAYFSWHACLLIEKNERNAQRELRSYTLYIRVELITLQQQPARRLMGIDYQHITANLGNIWETLWTWTAHSAPDFLKISNHFCHFDYFSIF